jgi:hypothetical protein
MYWPAEKAVATMMWNQLTDQSFIFFIDYHDDFHSVDFYKICWFLNG